MAISSDVALQRLWRTQFPLGPPLITVRNTFIHVEDTSPKLSSRRPHHSKTLHATMPTSPEVFTGITDVDGQDSHNAMDKIERALSATSTAGSETGINDSFDTVSTASDEIYKVWPSSPSMPLGHAGTLTKTISSTPMQIQRLVDDSCSPGSSHNQKHVFARGNTCNMESQRPFCKNIISRTSSASVQSDHTINTITSGARLLTHKSEDRITQTRIDQTGEVLTGEPGECTIGTSIGEANLLFSMSASSSAGGSQSPFQSPLTESVLPVLNVFKAPTTRAKVMTWTQCNDACSFKVCWTLDARKLRGSDKQAVSQPVELPLAPGGQHVKLRILIYPTVHVRQSQSLLSFKASRSRGFIQIKCEYEKSCQTIPVRFTISVGSGRHSQGSRGPVDHDFATNGICGLPKEQDNWDFFSATETCSMTVPVFLGLTRVEEVQSLHISRESSFYASNCLRCAH